MWSNRDFQVINNIFNTLIYKVFAFKYCAHLLHMLFYTLAIVFNSLIRRCTASTLRQTATRVGKNNIFPEKSSDNGGLQLAAKDSLLLLLLYLRIQRLRNHTCKKETWQWLNLIIYTIYFMTKIIVVTGKYYSNIIMSS